MFGQVMINFVASRGWTTCAVFYTGDSLGSQSNVHEPKKNETIHLDDLLFCSTHGPHTLVLFYILVMDNIALWANKRNIKIGYRRAFWEMGGSSDVGPALDALQDSGQRIVLIAAVGVPQIRLMIEAV